MIKQIISAVAIALVFVAYVPYIRDTIKGKTKPHVYSWFMYSFLSLIIFSLQIYGGAGVGAYVTLSTVFICGLIFVLAMRNGDKNIVLADTLFFIASLFATAIWLFADQPYVSIVLLVTIDVLATVPTIRKSWNRPYEETLFAWSLNAFRIALSIFALQEYNLLTVLFPASWVVLNLSFSAMIVLRRRRIPPTEA